MAEDGIPSSELSFPNVLNQDLKMDGDLEGLFQGSGLITMRVSKNKTVIPAVKSIVCDFNTDSKIDRKGLKSHDFGILIFYVYFYGLGSEIMSSWLPSPGDKERELWGKVVRELKLLEPNSKLTPSLIQFGELVGNRFLEWLKHAPERTCFLCEKELRAGEVVATLVNLKTKTLACRYTKINGTYHLFHVPCLIKWILLCDFMIECGARGDNKDPDQIDLECQCQFCPDCLGTGMKDEVRQEIEYEEEEGLTDIILSRLELLKTKALDGYTKWMESASEASKKDDKVVGLTFSASPEDPSEEIEILKSFHIYEAIEGWLKGFNPM